MVAAINSWALSTRLYPEACINHAIQQFRSLCKVQQEIHKDHIQVTIVPLESAPEETRLLPCGALRGSQALVDWLPSSGLQARLPLATSV